MASLSSLNPSTPAPVVSVGVVFHAEPSSKEERGCCPVSPGNRRRRVPECCLPSPWRLRPRTTAAAFHNAASPVAMETVSPGLHKYSGGVRLMRRAHLSIINAPSVFAENYYNVTGGGGGEKGRSGHGTSDAPPHSPRSG